MKIFDIRNRNRNEHTRRVYAQYELVYTLVDFLAAFLFIIGSIMFFYPKWVDTGTWMFLVGSIFFAAKPTVRMTREIKLYRMGKLEDLANRAIKAQREN